MQRTGAFLFVVGPSGAGKDTLIDGARARFAGRPDVVFARRVITRPETAVGEDHIGVSDAEFSAQCEADAFLITWEAHNLRYGLQKSLLDHLAEGRYVIANGSRAMIEPLSRLIDGLVVIDVTAPIAILAERIAKRGRETAAEIALRLARTVDACPAAVRRLQVCNDRSAEIGIARFIDTLNAFFDEPERRVVDPAWSDYLAKLGGATLDEAAYTRLLDAIADGRFDMARNQAILKTLIEQVSDAEIGTIARVRTRRMPRVAWERPIVVDKHSMGGVCGSRITPIVVAIVTACGLTMPKTSSRAITSASGTADAMDVVAHVDLDPEAFRRVVHQVNGCIAWNGKLNHSRVDDLTNAMVRPLNLDTRRWSVASILSKKYSAGATHVVIDLPYGANTKIKTQAEADELGRLFEEVGSRLDLTVRSIVSSGAAPIGRGIGPVLEMRDVFAVFHGDADAVVALREKALLFAGTILASADVAASVDAGIALARDVLSSGRALQSFEAIVDAQGRKAPAELAPVRHYVTAPHAGVVTALDGWTISGIARETGAPWHPGAGVDILCNVGDRIREGNPILCLYAADEAGASRALQSAAQDAGVALA